MYVMTPYDQMYTTDKQYIFMKSGRAAGKSKASAQYIVKRFFGEDGDIFVGRAYGSDIQQSIYQEIISVVEEMGVFKQIETRTRPLKIINKINGNKIYFSGIGGADKHRTKGMTFSKDLTMIVYDELQQIENEENLREANATLLRKLKPTGKVIYMFNPPKLASHWVNEFFRMSKHNSAYLCIETTYKDIAKVLGSPLLESIEHEKMIDPNNYRNRYLGETEGLFGAVYNSFDRKKHLINKDALKRYIKKVGIFNFIVGADPASTRDSTALIPALLLRNGQMVIIDYFFHDPQKNGSIPNARLWKFVREWLHEIKEEWGLLPQHRVEMIFDSNGASQDLMNTLSENMSGREVNTQVFRQKRIIEMADVMRNAFSKNLILISDNGGYKNYITGTFMWGINPLVQQLEQVVWNEAGDGFDKHVPNDATDGLTYATVWYFRNQGNMNFPEQEGFYNPKYWIEEEAVKE